MSGVFVTFEGGEGSGKSTQLARLAERLRAAGARVRTVREPGGTHVGERVRDILLDPAHEDIDARAELLLYEASRAQLVAEVIAPALAEGEVVLCDRFADSTVAYQGFGRGLSLAQIDALNETATNRVWPDVTLILDIDPVRGLARATAAGADRLEGEGPAFHDRVRAGFLAIARAEPERFRIVDADGTPDEVEARLIDALVDVPALAPYLARP